MPDIFDDLDPDFPPEEEHDYDKAVSEVEETLTPRELFAIQHSYPTRLHGPR